MGGDGLPLLQLALPRLRAAASGRDPAVSDRRLSFRHALVWAFGQSLLLRVLPEALPRRVWHRDAGGTILERCLAQIPAVPIRLKCEILRGVKPVHTAQKSERLDHV